MDRFSSLPEGCISDILVFTSPRDVCRSSATSREIQLAADSDSVWERFLPLDYKEIVSRSLTHVVFDTKKQLFFGLSNSPILIDDGNMSFGLDKESGKKCYMLGARALTIIWTHTGRHWSWISLPESRFAEVAQLNDVCWLEIKGRMDTRLLSWKTTYVAYLVYKITERSNGLNGLRLEASIRFVYDSLDHDNVHQSIVYFERSGRYSQAPLDGRLPRNRSDGWKEIELGEFVCDDGNNGEVEMRLLGIEGHSWKTGLIVQGMEFRPKIEV